MIKSAANYVFIALVLNIFDEALLLVQLPTVEDNDIMTSEAAIRVTTNKLFSTLQLRMARTTTKMKQYSRVHNYLMSLTLQDYHSLKEIAKLTRLDKNNIGNITTDFIALLNEILDEENFLELQNVIGNNDVKKDYDIVDEVQKFELLRTYYLGPYNNINKDILRVLDGDASLGSNFNTSLPVDATFAELDTKNVINNDILQSLIDIDEYGDDTKFTMDEDDHNDSDVDPYWHESDMPISGRRIYKGRKARSRHFPFMASIQIFKKFQCGGSIISEDLIVTAASCLQIAYNNRFYRENPSFLSIRIGTQFFESGGDHIPVLELYFYPGYDPHNLRHNLAVLRVVRRIKFGKRAKKIEIDREAAPLPINTDGITIVGWGATQRGNILHNPFISRMRYAIVDVYPLADCQEIYSKEYVTEHNFCAGYITSGTGACNRDVGGPGITSGVLRGVISFGAPVCGTPDAPTVFTKLGHYYDWIEEIMEQDAPWRKRRTTLKLNLTLFQMKPKPTTPKTRWTLSPVNKETTPFVVPIHTTGSPNDLRHLDRTLFKDFLKTMFNSLEIQEYLDTMKQTAKPIKKSKSLSSNVTTSVTEKVLVSEANSLPIKQPPQSLALEVANRYIVKATRIDGAEPTPEPDSSSDSDEFMKNFTIISVAENTKGPKTTQGLIDVESPANVEGQANVESQENVESVPYIENQANIQSEENIESQTAMQNLASTDRSIVVSNSTMLEYFNLLENKDSNEDKELENFLQVASELDSTVTTTTVTVSKEPQLTTAQEDKLIDEAILTLLYLSDNEKGNVDSLAKTLTNKNMAPESTDNEKKRNKKGKPKDKSANASSPKMPKTNLKLETFKDFTYRGDGKALKTFLSQNTDIFDILQDAMIEFNKTTRDEPQRVTKL